MVVLKLMLAASLLIIVPSFAEARPGRDRLGNCVNPCTRGGLTCPYCTFRIGPGAGEWSAELDAADRQNEEFRNSVRQRALEDPEYRRSDDYDVDRQALRKATKTMDLMRRLDKVSASE
jgi:hypothetical protein